MQADHGRAKAEHYKELGKRADEAIRTKVHAGRPSGRFPLGYARQLGDDGLAIDIHKASCIIEAFARAADGSSLGSLLAHITHLGLISASGKPLSLSTLHHMLRNPFYCGMIRYKGDAFRGSHEPLVSRTLFDRAQRSLRKRRC